jgi:hypothetical protein
MLSSVRLPLKQHRFEVGAAALAALLVGVSALVVAYRLNAVEMPAGCFDAWLRGAAESIAGCVDPTRVWASINENEAGKVFAAMTILPFAVGLLGGVPLVARELEARTAQTAWFLWGSRLRWLARQLLPVIVLLGAVIAFAAFAMEPLEATQRGTSVTHIALHGPIVIAWAFASLGIGLLVGAVLGRTLPAFIVGVVLCFVVAVAAVEVRLGWLDDHKTVIGPIQGSGYSFGILVRAPDGALLSFDEAYSRVPPGQGDYSDQWLIDNGYEYVQLGVTTETLMAWTPYEVAGLGLVGVAAIAATGLVVSRRRPT